MPYRFRPVTPADLPLLAGWLRTSAVAEWWVLADGSPSPPVEEADLAEPDVRRWLVSHESENGGAPFAYIQDYDPHYREDGPGDGPGPDHHFARLPAGSRGIDQYIGVPAMLGRGHGPGFIAAHCARLMGEGAPERVRAIGTDPDPANARAIRAYEKAGFVRTAVRDTAWGRAQLMERWA